jgi:hypothetical protein
MAALSAELDQALESGDMTQELLLLEHGMMTMA